MDRPRHKPDWFADRGPMIGEYADADLRDGDTSQVIVMNKAQIEEIRAVSKTAKDKDSPWNRWPDRMWKKTVIRQLAKFVPTSAEYRREQLRDVAQVETERVTVAGHDLRDMPDLLDGGDVLDGELVEEPSPATPVTTPSTEEPADIPEGDQGEGQQAQPEMATGLCRGLSITSGSHWKRGSPSRGSCRRSAWWTTSTFTARVAPARIIMSISPV